MEGATHHLARFAGVMRAHGIRVGLSDEIDSGAALRFVDLLDRNEVRSSLRIAFKVPHEAWAMFDRLFDEHWGGAAEVPIPPASSPRDRRGAVQWRWDGTRVRLEAQSAGPADGDAPGYSPEQLLRRKPFDRISDAELKDVEQVLARLARSLATRRSRRLVPTAGRGLVDLRRSFRNALGSRGELLRLARRARVLEEPRVVLLFDTSGSMDPHTRFHLAFAFALRRAIRRVEIFAFNTSLTRVSGDIAPARILRSLDELAANVPDWSGGTRIGQCLAEFASGYPHMVGRDTTMVIVSDGLDLGDATLLTSSMRALHDRARRVIWLNPLLGDARYEPAAAGMRAALPYIDHFAPGHDLESLERLARMMN